MRRLKQIGRWIVRVVVGLVLLVLALGVWIAFSDSGGQFAVRQGLDWYTEQIPGDIQVGAIEGSLHDLVLKDVRIANSQGEPLVVAARIEIEANPEGLLDDLLRAELRVNDAHVHLRTPGFEDLAMPGPADPPVAEPTEPSATVYTALVTADAVTVTQHAPAGAQDLVQDFDLTVEARYAGEVADVVIARARGAVPAADLHAHGLSMQASWAEPIARVKRVRADTSLGHVRGEALTYDIEAQTGAGVLDARLTEEGARRFVPPQVPGVPTARVEFTGGLTDLTVQADIETGPTVASVAVEGALQPAPDLTIKVDAEGYPLRLVDPTVGGIVDTQFSLTAKGPETPLEALGEVAPEAVHATLDLTGKVVTDPQATGEFPAPLPAEIDLDFTGSLSKLALQLKARSGPRLTTNIDLRGAVQPAPDLTLDLKVDGVPAAWLAEGARGDLGIKGDVSIAAPPTPLTALGELALKDLRAAVDLRCVGCQTARTGKLALAIEGKLADGRAQADVDLNALGVVADISGSATNLTGAPAIDGRWDVRIASLSKTRRAAAQLVDMPRIRGRVQTSGRCTGEADALNCTGTLLARRFRGFDVQAPRTRANFKIGMRDAVTFDATIVSSNLAVAGIPDTTDARVQISGTPSGMDFKVHADRPLTNEVTVAGRVDLGSAIRLRLDTLRGQLKTIDFKLKQRARIALRGSNVHIDGFELGLEDGTVTASGALRPRGRNDLRFAVKNLDLGDASFLIPTWEADGLVELSGHVQGRGRAPEIDLMVRARDLEWREHDFGDLTVDARYHEQIAHLDLDWDGGDQRRVAIDGRAPVKLTLAGDVRWHADRQHEAKWVIEGIDTRWVRTLVSLPPQVHGDLASTLTLTGTLDAPRMDLRVSGDLRPDGLEEAVPYALAVLADKAKQTAKLDITPPKSDPLRLNVKTRADLLALKRGDAVVGQIPFEATLRSERFLVAALAPLLPDAVFNPQGALALRADATGTLGDPTLSGNVALTDGGITVTELNQRWRQIEMRAGLQGDTLTLETFKFRSGKDGRGRIDGSIALSDGLKGDLTVRIDDLPVAAPGAPPMKIDTRVEVALKKPALDKPMDIDVAISDTIVRVFGPPSDAPRSIPQSADVVILAADARPPVPKETTEPGPGMRITVRLVEPLSVRGPMVDLKARGQLAVKTGVDAGQSGLITIVNGGTFELVGNRFVIDQGEVTLPDAVGSEPFVNITTNTETAEATVTATIRGPVSAPKLVLSSVPAMPQHQVLTLLITGTTEPDDAEESGAADKAAALLASFSNPELERQMQDRFGIDRLRLGFGETTDQPVVSVGKHISEKLYVETTYHHNAPEGTNQRDISGRYTFTPRWTLETHYGDALVGGVDVFWRRAFGGTVPPPKGDADAEKDADVDAEKDAETDPGKGTDTAPFSAGQGDESAISGDGPPGDD